MPGRLRQEDVLDHEMFELGERDAGVMLVGIRHGRILAHDIHRLDLVGMDRVDDLDHRQPALGIELGAPEGLHPLADLDILHREIVGEDHGDEAGIRGALDIVLPAERMQPRPGPPHMTRDH